MPNIVHGTSGNDLIDWFTQINSWIYDDIIYGHEGNDEIYGLAGNDTIFGGDDDDEIYGGGDNDILKGGGGADFLCGGEASDSIDTAAYDESAAGVSVSLMTNAGAGGDAEGDQLDSIENLRGSAYADTLTGDNDVNVLQGLYGNDTLKGWGGADELWGGTDNDFLYGMHGADTLQGEEGNDYLDGGPGWDNMDGGSGNDTFIVDDAGDETYESAGQGRDVVRTSVSWILTPGAHVESLQTTDATGTAAINLTGNALGNQIIGNDGANVINGGGGVDQMIGRNGNDTYIVDNAGDEVNEAGSQGGDVVRTSVSWAMTPGADVETLRTTNDAGMAAINLTGNATNNSVIGNSGPNVINGGAGDDWLTGLGGADSFRFDTQLDAATNVDVILDYDVVFDTILLDDVVFSAFANGPLAAERFVVGAAAQDASDNIIYDSGTGAIYYDSDGNGAAAAVQFAHVSAGLAITHLDFIVV